MTQRFVNLGAFLFPAGIAFYLGWLAHSQGLVDLDTTAAMGHAWRVFYEQERANLALIGFGRPPLLALLFLPGAAFTPNLLVTGLAAPLLGAFFCGLSVFIVWRLSRSLGLSSWLALFVSALFLSHPVLLSYAMLGSRGIVLTFVLLGLSASLVSWQRQQRVRDFVTGSFFAAAAIALAYEAIVLVIGAALFIAIYACQGSQRSLAKAEGLLIAFLLPAAYVAFVWIGANWAIMGDPWHFWRQMPLGERHWGIQLSSAFAIALAANPLLLGLLYFGLLPQSEKLGAPAAWLLLLSFPAGLIFPSATSSSSASSLWPAYPVSAANALGAGGTLFIALLAYVIDAFRHGEIRKKLSPGFIIILSGSIYLAMWQQATQKIMPVGLRAVFCGQPAFARDVKDEWEAGHRLRDALTDGRRHVIIGPTAYVIALRAEARQNVVVRSEAAQTSTKLSADMGDGSYAVLYSPPEKMLQSWRAYKPHLRLQLRWRQGLWQCYQFVAASPAKGSANHKP